MYDKGRTKGTIRFALQADGAKKVEVAGDFTDWHPQALKKQKGGSFSASLSVKPGTHEYKFVVDGDWIVDPDNNAWAMNPFGTMNSVLTVE